MTKRESLIWAAGLFEGEGCISTGFRKEKGKGKIRTVLAISSTDLDVLKKLQNICGGTVIGPKIRKIPNRKPVYEWRLHKFKEIAFLLEFWLPFLGERRRDKAAEALSELYTFSPLVREGSP